MTLVTTLQDSGNNIFRLSKKQTICFVLHSTFRNFGYVEVTVTQQCNIKNSFFFCIAFVFS